MLHSSRKETVEDKTDIPIIAITANAFNEEIEDERRAGMTDHDAKPIDVEHLKQTLYKILSSTFQVTNRYCLDILSVEE